jgi:hypothetical protein
MNMRAIPYQDQTADYYAAMRAMEAENPSLSRLTSFREYQNGVFDRVGANPATNQPVYGFRAITSADCLPKELNDEPRQAPETAPIEAPGKRIIIDASQIYKNLRQYPTTARDWAAYQKIKQEALDKLRQRT